MVTKHSRKYVQDVARDCCVAESEMGSTMKNLCDEANLLIGKAKIKLVEVENKNDLEFNINLLEAIVSSFKLTLSIVTGKHKNPPINQKH